MKKQFQIDWVREQLELGRNLTDDMARDEQDIPRLGALIHRLKGRGVNIKSRIGLVAGHPARATYWLKKEDVRQTDMFAPKSDVERILSQ